jgi:hypothetical protein
VVRLNQTRAPICAALVGDDIVERLTSLPGIIPNIRALFDQEMRRSAVGPDGKPVAQPPHLTRHEGSIIWQDLAAADFDDVIAQEIKLAATGNREFEWKLYSHDAPLGLAEALVAAGFVQQPTETIMVRRADLGPATDVAGLTITKVTTLEDATACFDLLFDVFGNNFDVSPQALLDRSLGGEPFYLGHYEGRLDVPPGCNFGGLYGGATHKDYRRRGFYRPIVQTRCNAALEAGCSYVFSEALPTSRPILQALGFEPLGEVTGFVFTP